MVRQVESDGLSKVSMTGINTALPLRLCRLSAILAILTSATACRGDGATRTAGIPSGPNRACFAGSQSDRWAPGTSPAITAVGADPDAGFELGIAGSGGHLFLYDHSIGRILVADSLGRVVRTFGRPGHGPGDILPPGALSRVMPKGRRADWIDASGDTIAVLDGLTIHWFSPDGDLVRDAGRGLASITQAPPPIFTTRIRRFGDRDLIDVEWLRPYRDGATGRSPQREFTVWAVGQDTGETVMRLGLTPLPLMNRGPFIGVEEAQPFWDVHNGCIVATDGGTPSLFVQRIGQVRVDTMPIPLPEAVQRGASEQAELLGGPVPEPALQRRVRRFIMDPDGWAWIETNRRSRSSGDVEILRVHIASGQHRLDTIPAFPSAFREDGSVVGLQRMDRTGGVRVIIIRAADRGGVQPAALLTPRR
jgi:hypothetical protein